MANMGLGASSGAHLLSHTATMVAVPTSMIGGAFVAVAVGALGVGRVPVAVAAAAGVLVSVALTPQHSGEDQARRWRTAEQSVPVLLPVRTSPYGRLGPDHADVAPGDDDPSSATER